MEMIGLRQKKRQKEIGTQVVEIKFKKK